jgi:hypothetical protein
MHIAQPIDLVYFGAAIALIALALYWTHAAENKHGETEQAEEAGTGKAKH